MITSLNQNYIKYAHFGLLTKLPDHILANLLDYYDVVSQSNPDMTYGYYHQWFSQVSDPPNMMYDIDWVNWRDDTLEPTVEFFSQYVKQILRFRVSLLHKDHDIDYHFAHDLPRIHIPLNDVKTTFVIKDSKGREYFYPMEYGNAYFVNVTLEHKVIGSKIVDRKNCFFCFEDFDDSIKDRFKLNV